MDVFVFVRIWLFFFQMNKASVINHACLLFSTLPIVRGRFSQRIEVKLSFRIISTGDASQLFTKVKLIRQGNFFGR